VNCKQFDYNHIDIVNQSIRDSPFVFSIWLPAASIIFLCPSFHEAVALPRKDSHPCFKLFLSLPPRSGGFAMRGGTAALAAGRVIPLTLPSPPRGDGKIVLTSPLVGRGGKEYSPFPLQRSDRLCGSPLPQKRGSKVYCPLPSGKRRKSSGAIPCKKKGETSDHLPCARHGIKSARGTKKAPDTRNIPGA